MYTVYLDDDIIYSPLLIESGLIIFSGVINLKLNEAGTFEFIIPKDNPYYDSIIPRKSIIRVYDGEELIFKGVTHEFGKEFNKMKTVYCKGVLSFLEDSLCRPFEFSGTLRNYLLQRLQAHNDQMDRYKKFVLGNVTVQDNNNYVHRYKETFEDTMSVLRDQLLDTHGGYFKVTDGGDLNGLDYISDFNDTTIQTIEFGKNLLDFVQNSTTDTLYTALVPYGADVESETDTQKKVDITSVNGGRDYIIDQSAANIYGLIWHYEEYGDITLPANLLTRAREDLQANVDINMTLEISAFDLSLIDADLDRIGLGKYTRIISLPHDFDRVLLCNEVEINLDDPGNNRYIFGASLKRATDYIKTIKKKTAIVR